MEYEKNEHKSTLRTYQAVNDDSLVLLELHSTQGKTQAFEN